jgi:hypothetical protein
MYLGSSDAIYLAEELAGLISSGKMDEVSQQIRTTDLKPVQAMYVMGILCSVSPDCLLSDGQASSLMKVLNNDLNKG